MHPSKISIQDYSYHLPDECIALHPLEQRDASKLLIWQNDQISESRFSGLADFIPENTLMVFNDTKVINARIRFQKPSGSVIEIFCLEPAGKITEYSRVLSQTAICRWKCFVGGASKWKEIFLEKNIETGAGKILLKARIVEKITEAYIVEFSWEPASLSFAEITEAAGQVPLPPYIKRDTEQDDTNRYQTIFAAQQGSVAAPTASLHFTEEIFQRFAEKNIEKLFVTLHVGAGTFKPVKADRMEQHEMHAEYIDVGREAIQKIMECKHSVAVAGTTSLRTVETLYWLGVKAAMQPEINFLSLQQWEVYEPALAETKLTKQEALQHLLYWMDHHSQTRVFTQTQLLVAPGYRFRVANILITNFHQPQSTLLLLVAAAVGPNWKKLYQHAMQNNFRFLSYGDANLIFL